MIINISRAKTRLLCRKKSFNTYHRRLQEPRRSMNLTDGSAFHAGVARGLATKQWFHDPTASMCECAHCVSKDQFAKDIAGQPILPELAYQLDDHRDMIAKMIECYGDAFETQSIQVIQPECEFDVELPGTHHSCIMLHHLEIPPGTIQDPFDKLHNAIDKWGPPDPQAILEGRIRSPHSHIIKNTPACECWVPHRFVGKTDAVVVWNGLIWLLEHKTTSISGEMFWSQWRLDIQPTGYIYGIQRALNVKVGGFILNAIVKPSEAQVSNWNKKRKDPSTAKGVVDYIKYEREAFLRSDEDLHRFESELISLCNEWERDILSGSFPMSPLAGICNQYNHTCEFHSCCTSHDARSELEVLATREKDYVDVKLEELSNAHSV